MKKIIILAAFAALSLFCSCQKENIKEGAKNNMVPFEIKINTELDDEMVNTQPGTRVWLEGSDQSLKWAADDKVSAYDGVVTENGGIQFTVSSRNGSSATLSGSISGTATGPIYFLYPYQKYVATRGKSNSYTTNMISDGVIFPVEVPVSYKTKTNQIPYKALMLVGKMATPESTDPVTMKTPMGFVKFKLKTDPAHPITKIEITSENTDVIAGTVAIDYTGSEPVLKIQGRESEAPFNGHPSLSSNQQRCAYDITITPHDDYGGAFIDGTYYFALPPQEYNWGVRMRFTDDSGMIAEKRPNGRVPLVVNRGKVKDLGTIDMADLDWYEAIQFKVMNAILDCTWPFNETKPSSFADGTEYTFTYGPDGDEFKLKCIGYAGGMYSTSGINIRGNKAYFQIPGRPGKIIHEVTLRVCGQGANCGNPIFADTQDPVDGKYHVLKIGEDDPSNPGNKLPGEFAWLTPGNATDNALMDAWWGAKQFGWTKRWTNFASTEDTPYRIYLTATADFLKIMDLTIEYVDAP